MIANVNEQLWVNYDLDTAVFLDTIAYWIKKNADNKEPRNFHEGKYWTYNSLDAYTKMFPGWSKDILRRIIRNCVKNGLLLVGNFNRKGYDRTGWYSLTDKAIEYYPNLKDIVQEHPDSPEPASCGGSTTSSGRSTTAIPTLLPSSSNNTITTTSESCDSSAAATKANKKKITHSFMLALIAVYREIFPDNPQPHPRTISTSLEKTLQTLIKRWPEIQPNGNDLDLDSFRRYMQALRNLAPKFALQEYTTKDGHKRKNNMETFCRWNTLVKFLENQYS